MRATMIADEMVLATAARRPTKSRRRRGANKDGKDAEASETVVFTR